MHNRAETAMVLSLSFLVVQLTAVLRIMIMVMNVDSSLKHHPQSGRLVRDQRAREKN